MSDLPEEGETISRMPAAVTEAQITDRMSDLPKEGETVSRMPAAVTEKMPVETVGAGTREQGDVPHPSDAEGFLSDQDWEDQTEGKAELSPQLPGDSNAVSQAAFTEDVRAIKGETAPGTDTAPRAPPAADGATDATDEPPHQTVSDAPPALARDVEEIRDLGAQEEMGQVRKRRAVTPGKATPRAALVPAGVEEEWGGITLNKCLLLALVLVAVGFGIFGLASYRGPEEDPEQLDKRAVDGGHHHGDPELPPSGQLWMDPTLENAEETPSTASPLSDLLDKLDNESDQIQMMHVGLKAQVVELDQLLREDGGRLPIGSRETLRGLWQRLADHVSVGEAALRGLREGVRALRAAAEGPGTAPARDNLLAEALMLRRELDRQRGLVAAAREALAAWAQRADGPGDGAGADAEDPELLRLLEELERRAWQPERPGAPQPGGVRGNGTGEAETGGPDLRGGGGGSSGSPGVPGEGGKRRGRDEGGRGWDKKVRGRGDKERIRGRGGEEGGRPRIKGGREWEDKEEGGSWDRKGRGRGDEERAEGRGEEGGRPHRHHDHNRFWEPGRELAGGRHRYSAPVGCSDLPSCARREGRELFGVDLQPVTDQQLTSAIAGYVRDSGLGPGLARELAARSAPFFQGGVFLHHRVRLAEFLDQLEETAEEAAERELGDEDAAGDFEDYVWARLVGENAVRSRNAKKHKHKIPDHRHKEHGDRQTAGEGYKREQEVKWSPRVSRVLEGGGQVAP
ncbi:pre-B-cell leukemia transcription factor-interacting protein 1-like [Pristis pectinata]|uniref:pre-B-cell leukemia transcription factor-interacting protein 1-like n=1 Tax=Pristis pectinata TaxID=685728 RepID=UPI00223D16D9|nr:pre-B-cell leukemia transcription factor-interacting protein 1-like [Pristis pectinata]